MISQASRRLIRDSQPSASRLARTLFSSPLPQSPPELLFRIQRLSNAVLASNWADYMTAVQNSALWEVEMQTLERRAAHLAVPNEDIKTELKSLQQLLDCRAIAEDVRDHLNEVMEASTRSSGLAGTGVSAAEHVDNLNEQADKLGKVYDELLSAYPEFAPKVEEGVGHALALFRQKIRFGFSSQHKYFF